MGRKTSKVLTATQDEIKLILQDNMELIEDFLNYLETTDHSQETVKIYKNNLYLFFVYVAKNMKNKDFVDIKKRDIMNFQNYLIKNGLSSARIRNIKSSLSSMGLFIENILDEEEKWEDFRNIINKIPNPTLNKVREKTVMSDEQLDELLNKLVEEGKIQIACFVAMCAYSGARKSEMIQYKRSFFTEETVKNGLYVTPEIRTKGKGQLGKQMAKYCIKSKVDMYLTLWDKERERLGIDTDDLFVVKKEKGFRCAGIPTVNSWMATCSKIIGEDVYCHSYRHFFVSTLLRQNIPINIVKDIVGHASSEVTELYNDNPKENGFMKYFSDEGIVQVEAKSLGDI